MTLAYRAFLGLVTGTSTPSAPHTTLASLAALNEENWRDTPIAYVRGTADYLVHWEHAESLAASVDFTEYTTPNNHHKANEIYDRDTILDWLEQVLSDDEEPPTGIQLFFWDDNDRVEVPVELSFFNGSTEVPVELDHVGG